jgi:hypothetical protein
MKSKEEKLQEKIEEKVYTAFLEIIGTFWGITIGSRVANRKMRYFNDKTLGIRNRLIKDVGKLLEAYIKAR